MSDTAYVASLPECDIHKHELMIEGVPASYDGKTKHGPWAMMCQSCFEQNGIGLGTGRGQRLIVGEEPAVSALEKSRLIGAAIQAGDFDEVEDLVGDGDLTEWL